MKKQDETQEQIMDENLDVTPSIEVNDAPIEGEELNIPDEKVDDANDVKETKADDDVAEAKDDITDDDKKEDKSEENDDDKALTDEAEEGVKEENKVDDDNKDDENKDDKVEEEKKDETDTEEKTDDVEETKEEDKKEPEETIDDVKRELEEIKTIRDEENAIHQFEVEASKDDKYLDNLANTIASNLEQAIVNLGVDVNKTFDEIKKDDPEKAFKIKQMVEEAQRIQASEEARINEARKAKLQDIVFKRAGRLLDGFKLTDEESNVACEALIDIFNEAGLKDLDGDLVAKVRLAVGQAKLLVPKVEKVVEDVKEIAEDVKEIASDVVDPSVTAEDMANKDEVPTEEDVKEEDTKEEPKIDVSAFEEGASAGGTSPVEPSAGDLLTELNNIKDTRDRVAFYRAHQQEIEAQMKLAHGKKERNN